MSLLFLVIGFALFFVLDKKIPKLKQKGVLSDFHINNRVINLVFILAFLMSLITLIVNDLPLFRPLSFFISLAVMFGIISVEIANLRDKSLNNYYIIPILVKIMIVSFLFNSTFFMGIFYSNGDVTTHLHIVHTILNSEPISKGNAAPLYHIFWAISSMISGVSMDLAKFIMLFISCLGIPFMYLFCKVISEDEKASLYAALIFSFFTLTNRIRTDYEALAFPVFFLLLFYFLFRSERNPKDSLIAVILFTALAFTHFYYSSLFVIWLVLAFLTISIFLSYKNKNKFTKFLFFAGTLWAAKVVDSTNNLGWTVQSIINVISSPAPGTLQIQPVFLSAESSIFQFLGMHLSELSMFSLSIIAILLLLKKINEKNLVLVGSFISFSLITFIGIYVEGQKEVLAWGVSFRNFYLIALFLIIFGGYAIREIEIHSKNRRKIISAIFILFFVLSFFSITSQQANELDPVFYCGEVPSLSPTSYGEINILGDLFQHLPGDSIVVSDVRTTLVPTRVLLVSDKEDFKYRTFSGPSLSELNENYNYLIINMYSVSRGMILSNKRGLAINKDMLFNEAEEMNKVWDGGPIRVYHKG
jgi:hypothetical protein